MMLWYDDINIVLVLQLIKEKGDRIGITQIG